MLHEVDSEQTDLSDIGLCSVNDHERAFNIILCLLKAGSFEEALKSVKKLERKVPRRYKQDIKRLRVLIEQPTGEGDADLLATIEPFVSEHRLCNYFPLMEFSLPNGLSFVSRPSFSFPFVKPPNMIPNVDETLLFNEFGSSKPSLLAPNPQALWVKLQESTKAQTKY